MRDDEGARNTVEWALGSTARVGLLDKANNLGSNSLGSNSLTGRYYSSGSGDDRSCYAGIGHDGGEEGVELHDMSFEDFCRRA